MLHKFLKIMVSVLLIIITFASYPTIEPKAAQTATINTDVLNVRSGAGLTYNVIAKVRKNEKYTIIDRKNDWVKLQLNSKTSGWAASWLVKESNQSSPSASTVISNENGLRVRTGPGTNFQVIGSLSKGQSVPYVQKSGSWTKIKYNNQLGWVSSEYVTTTQGSSTEQSNSNTNKTGKVNTSVLNVRRTPALGATVVGKLLNGATVTILKEQNNWYEIKFNNGSAWVHKDYITVSGTSVGTPSTPPNNSNTAVRTAIVTASSLNVRDSGSLSGKIIASLKKGEQVSVENEVNNWSQLKLSNGKKGWVASWYLQFIEGNTTPPPTNTSDKSVKLLHNGTNIRSGASTSNSVVARGNEGDTFKIIETIGDWYKISLPSQKTGYVAGWIVEVTGDTKQIEKPGVNQYIKGKTIVIDPGHGGADGGTVGISGTLEKNLNLRTASIVYDKLKAAGANVVLTRNSDFYISLRSRVTTSHYHNADAFISIHYDSFADRSVRGITSYYYKNQDIPLASNLQSELVKNTHFNNRNHRFGNYQVLRENKKTSVLLELGFLSNSNEEYAVNQNSFQENVSNGIYYGLAQYFKDL